MDLSTVSARSVPAPVRLAERAWLVAIGAGAAEALLRQALPDPPTGSELGVRFAIYAALVLLVFALRSGRNVVRWALALLLGGVGLLSLVVEPASWLLAGGSALGFLATADSLTWGVVLLRVLHIGAVLVASVVMFRPDANEFFRRRRPGR
jgi:hypothetical protein